MMSIIQILCLVIIFDNCALGDKIANCQQSELHFEKVLGFKPFRTSSPQLLHKDDKHPITIDCIKKCQQNQNCRSFVLYYDSNSCYWFQNSQEIQEELHLIADKSVAWFTKICLKGKICEDKLWKVERIPGAILIGNDTKLLPKVTRNECQQNCLLSSECKSTKFRILNFNYNSNVIVQGNCTLSNADRHLLPNSFRVARDEEEYFENQCVRDEDDSSNTFCAFEEYVDVILQHVDIMYEQKTKDECEILCNNLKEFHCRGFSIYPAKPRYTCLLHSEDTKIYGPRSLKEVKHGLYYERARCLNITVTCTEAAMTVNYLPEVNFLGRLYMQGYSSNPKCYAKGQGFKPLSLKLPLPSSQCGILEALSSDNRKLLSASLVIQYNNLVQTQGDRLIRVGCIFGNDSKLVIGTGVTVTPEGSNNGSLLINSTNNVPNRESPLVQMKIVDHYSKEEVSDIQIGQELDLIIESSSKGNYDIWAAHLIAMTENGAESIFLLDDRGCPTDLNIFPYLQKHKTENKTFLSATFQAFKFSSSPAVRFSVIVQFCPNTCPEAECGNQYRQKRANLQTVNGTKIIKVNRSEFEKSNSQFYKTPLEIMVIVRNQKISVDRLALGSEKYLVAGFNANTNEVCVDYFLFIGMVIAWVLIQIIYVIACLCIVRKYKQYYREEYIKHLQEEYNKNFDLGAANLDSRRVHWADSRD